MAIEMFAPLNRGMVGAIYGSLTEFISYQSVSLEQYLDDPIIPDWTRVVELGHEEDDFAY